MGFAAVEGTELAGGGVCLFGADGVGGVGGAGDLFCGAGADVGAGGDGGGICRIQRLGFLADVEKMDGPKAMDGLDRFDRLDGLDLGDDLFGDSGVVCEYSSVA